MKMYFIIICLLLTGCVTYKPKTCTFICPNSNVPEGCYCLEDEIN